MFIITQELVVVNSIGESHIKDPLDWWDRDWHYRIPIIVGPADFDLINYPVEIEINFTQLMADAGGPGGAFNPDSLRSIQYDKSGPTANPVNQADGTLFLPLIFDNGTDYNSSSNANGTVTFLIAGTIPIDRQLYFQLYFDTGPNFTVLYCCVA